MTKNWSQSAKKWSKNAKSRNKSIGVLFRARSRRNKKLRLFEVFRRISKNSKFRFRKKIAKSFFDSWERIVRQRLFIDHRFAPTRSKMDILRTAIARLDADKDYWQKLFKSLKKDYKWVSENDGALLKR